MAAGGWNGFDVISAVVLSVSLVLAGWAAPSFEPDARTYRPPIAAPVADPFRPPPEPWLAGNRGIEYTTPPGSPVRAIGPGIVTFAGRVAYELDVTVRHPDGLRSSYVDLATSSVRVGDRVMAGQVIGYSTDRLHLGVRRGDAYLDPASLWGQRVTGGKVILVPSPGPARRARPATPDVAPVPGAPSGPVGGLAPKVRPALRPVEAALGTASARLGRAVSALGVP